MKSLKSNKHIHFMGIGGSGISGISVMAKKLGYAVSGCDMASETDYMDEVKLAGINVALGHDETHLKNADLLVVSPAILFQNRNHLEVSKARKLKKLLTWQEFLGKFLQKGKEVICIAGTHGKSTTTALTSLIFEKAGLDPSVVMGAEVSEWQSNFRVGLGDAFITEADEFNNNFLNYKPSAILINNIEFDHPDFFKSEEHMVESYLKFVKLLRGSRNLILNQDSQGNQKLYEMLDKNFTDSINIYGYTFEENPLLKLDNSIKIEINKLDESYSEFSIQFGKHQSHSYLLNISGKFNVANATGVIILSKLYGINDSVVKDVLKNFKGIGRRLDLIGEKNGIKVYDDYAHHPTAIEATITALRQKYPKNRIWAINEPHSFSRTKALLAQYKGVFEDANRVVIGPIFKARDTESFGVSGESIVEIAGHKNIIYLNEFGKIKKLLKKNCKKGDVVLVMGAGKSYQLSKDLLEIL